jgi:single-strand DNA-binding protein
MNNMAILLGNLGSDPELRVLDGGKQMLKFSLATSDSYKNKETGERVEKTQWHRCTAFGPRAESLARLLQKGDKIQVLGRIEYGSYEKEGVKHYTTDIIVTDVEFGNVKGKKSDASTNEDDTPTWDQ